MSYGKGPLYGDKENIPIYFPMPVLQTGHVIHFGSGKAVEGGAPEWVYFIEEASELIKEISKYARGKGSHEAITEEIADVYLTLANIQEIFGVSNCEIQHVINQKLAKNGLLPDKKQLIAGKF